MEHPYLKYTYLQSLHYLYSLILQLKYDEKNYFSFKYCLNYNS